MFPELPDTSYRGDNPCLLTVLRDNLASQPSVDVVFTDHGGYLLMLVRQVANTHSLSPDIRYDRFRVPSLLSALIWLDFPHDDEWLMFLFA